MIKTVQTLQRSPPIAAVDLIPFRTVMHSYINFAAWLLIAVGILYLLKPDIFKRGIWKRTSIAQRRLSAEGYIKYMRGVGVAHIVLGLVVLLWGWSNS